PFLLTAAFVGIVCVPRSFSENKKEAASAILDRAKMAMDIRSVASKPFRMAAGFHFDGTSDEPAVDGLFTEIWKTPDQWRIEINVPDFSQIEIGMGDKRWLSHDLAWEPSHFGEIRKLFRFTDFEVGKISKVWETRLGNERVQCVSSHAKATQDTFCFDTTSGVLLQTKTTRSGFQHECEYSNYQKYVGKQYPKNIRCTRNGDPWIEATITDFRDDSSPTDSRLFVPAAGAVEEPVCSEDSEHKAPRPLHTPDPKYPVNSLPPNGDSVIEGVVGVDGELTPLALKHS